MTKGYESFFNDLPEAKLTPISDIAPDLGEISIAAYHEHGVTPPFRMLDEQNVPSLLHASRNCAVKEASTDGWKKTGIEPIWGSQLFPGGHAINTFFARPEFIQLAEELARQPVQPIPECWSSLYRTDEYVDPHKDWRGAVHLIVCGRAPAAPENGGSLVVRSDEKNTSTEIFLKPGQAIAIDAQNLEHSTIPLRPTPTDTEPLRYAWIARYLDF